MGRATARRQGATWFQFGMAYSWRKDVIGSTFVTRRAGIKQASKATTSSNNVTAANVTASVAFTPKSKLFISRVSAERRADRHLFLSRGGARQKEIRYVGADDQLVSRTG